MNTTGRLYELRTYTAFEGKLDDLLSRFENYTIRLFEKHGMKIEGFWIPVDNPEFKLVYILSYPSLQAREEYWEKFQNDPEWIAARGASNANGDLLANKESVYLKAADFSSLK
ncbi:NIPSNAP family protein [Dyadobacter subterraneus]|uniref:NIPSNAP family protein n=1 Tax=Dyadobacter subterraneus TaxID=2773304 RepID=A0ABR9WGA4_9BACT|nr:NIPSNAP family protein [Dyadobacter subterraneus]MBE9463174.1 NIPSNAP family protein [Dyadobacter subterraneus]